MPRAHFHKAVIRRVSGLPADGSVQVLYPGTDTPFDQPLYTGDTGTTTHANPFPFTNGVVDFFLDTAQRVKLVITPTSSTAQTFDHVDVQAPAGLRRVVIPHTFGIPGDILAVSGTDNHIPPFFSRPGRVLGGRVQVLSGGTSGNGATITVGRLAGGVLTEFPGWAGVLVTQTATDLPALATPVSLASNEQVSVRVTGVTGTPKDLTVTLFIEYTAG